IDDYRTGTLSSLNLGNTSCRAIDYGNRAGHLWDIDLVCSGIDRDFASDRIGSVCTIAATGEGECRAIDNRNAGSVISEERNVYLIRHGVYRGGTRVFFGKKNVRRFIGHTIDLCDIPFDTRAAGNINLPPQQNLWVDSG